MNMDVVHGAEDPSVVQKFLHVVRAADGLKRFGMGGLDANLKLKQAGFGLPDHIERFFIQ